MYRNEEASDPLINKLERQSLPSFSTIGKPSLSDLHFELRYRGTSFKVQGGLLNWYFLGPKLHKRTVR